MGSLFCFMDQVKNNRAVYRLPDGGTRRLSYLFVLAVSFTAAAVAAYSQHVIIAVAQSFTIVFVHRYT